MGFPDRIERTVEIGCPPARVWAALTTADGLSAWFGERAEIDLRPGGAGSMSGDEHRSDFTLEPAGEGTRLTVVETGFAQLSAAEYEASYSGNVKGWAAELGDLVSSLDAA